MSGAIVTWTAIEFAAAMKCFEAPWLDSSFTSGVILLGLTVLLTTLVVSTFRSGLHPMIAPRDAPVLLAVLIVGSVGCSPSNQIEPIAAARLQHQLDKYDNRIQRPYSAMNHGLLRALCSNDPKTRAQAAIAFGKSRRVNRVIKKELETIALSDESRLSQFAALMALSRLRKVSPEGQRLLDNLGHDNEWSIFV